MRRLTAAIVWMVASLVTPQLGAQEAFFTEGNRLYQEDDYTGAIRAYERILEEGYESGALYYNLGSAYFKQGRLGQAILHYERALRLLPGDGDVRANLELARSLTTDDITPLPTFLPLAVARWWVDLLPLSSLRVTVAAGYVLAIAGLTAVVLRRRTPFARWAGRAAGAGGMLCLVFGINLFLRETGIGRPDEAVVLAEAVSVQSAPSDDPDLQLFTIHEGTKVRLDQAGELWAEVVLADGRVGWVPVEALGRI